MGPNFTPNGKRSPRNLRFRRTCFDRLFGEPEFRSTRRLSVHPDLGVEIVELSMHPYASPWKPPKDCCIDGREDQIAGGRGRNQIPWQQLKIGRTRGRTIMAGLAAIEGTASYREQIALSPGAILEVELLDISRADAPSIRLASIRVKGQGQVPIPFTLCYDPALVEPAHSYSVSAKLILRDKVGFRWDTVYPVLTRGAGDTVDILMVRTAAGNALPPEPPGASGRVDALVGPTWVAEDIGGKGVIDNLQSHITLLADGEAQGSGRLQQISRWLRSRGRGAQRRAARPGTKKACLPALMGQEDRFHEALGQARSYRIEKGILYLIDARGTPVTRLWRRE